MPSGNRRSRAANSRNRSSDGECRVTMRNPVTQKMTENRLRMVT
nr:MAG TPA: hypothetical protein [Caudoviricetes sp.]